MKVWNFLAGLLIIWFGIAITILLWSIIMKAPRLSGLETIALLSIAFVPVGLIFYLAFLIITEK